jgi:hypothetical protein
MVKNKKHVAPSGATEKLAEQARGIIDHAFQFFSEHFARISNDLEMLDKEHKEVKERIKRGARRTDGRIV